MVKKEPEQASVKRIPDQTAMVDDDSSAELSGKRKRRPSTMTMPPSTITKSHSPVEAPSASHKVKIRLASKSESPEAKAESMVKTSKKKIKREVSQPADEADGRKVPSTTENAKHVLSTSSSKRARQAEAHEKTGYESDGNAEGALLRSLAGPDADVADDESDLEARLPKRASVSVARKRSLQSISHTLEPPPLLSRRGGLKTDRSFASSTQPEHGSTPPSARQSLWSWNSTNVSLPLLRFRLDNAIYHMDDEESSVADDEDDFHVAMLDGGDFDGSDTDLRTADTPSIKDGGRASKSSDDSDTDYTPATTPQSPRSTCDGPEQRSNAEQDDNDSKAGVRDAVFSHALETSSRRPHTHAGALTLSLPFDEAMQANEDDPVADSSARQRDTVSARRANTLRVASQQPIIGDGAKRAVVEADLLSTGDLELSGKHAALALSSPSSLSAFASPNVSATEAHEGAMADPTPLKLPAHHGADDMRDLEQNASDTDVKMTALYSSDDSEDDLEADEQTFTHTVLAFGPPESLCLSELDRAWEQSEYLSKARRVAKLGGNIVQECDSAVQLESSVEPKVCANEEEHTHANTPSGYVDTETHPSTRQRPRPLDTRQEKRTRSVTKAQAQPMRRSSTRLHHERAHGSSRT